MEVTQNQIGYTKKCTQRHRQSSTDEDLWEKVLYTEDDSSISAHTIKGAPNVILQVIF